jgi:twitching motility protein PilT
MAAFDALLHLLIAQGADSLALSEGAVPALTKAGEQTPLSMPPLARETLARFVADLPSAGEQQRYVLDGKGVRAAFDITVEGDGRIVFRLSRDGGQAPSGASPARTAAVMATSAAGALGRGGAAVVGENAGIAPIERSASTDGDATTANVVAGSPAADFGALGDGADVARIEQLVEHALSTDATDLLVSSGTEARLKIGGELRTIPDSSCDAASILTYLALDEDQSARALAGHTVDIAREVPGGRIRANVFRHRNGLAASIRPVRRVRSLAELGLPADLKALVRFHDGLVLMVGPAGSGKSSTLAALIAHLTENRACHVITVEDPIEFEYEHGRSMIHQREVGAHVGSFAEGLWAALRESPDVILLGEMRDPATMAAALTAAETGHLVLSTLHSGNAAMAIDRIIDSFPPHQQAQVRLQLSTVLRAVVTQVLLPARTPGKLVPAIEKMLVTHAIAHAIRDGRGHQLGTQIQTGREEGMVSLELSLADLVRRRVITTETAMVAAREPELLRKLLGS